jgi:hypothetical protein
MAPASYLLIAFVGAAAALSGDLFYAACNLPSCDTLTFDAWSLGNNTSTTLYTFPFGEFEDGYVADSFLLGSSTVLISLQYDSNPDQGYLVEFDLNSNSILKGYNTSQCFSLWADPADATGDALLCLALEARCDGGAQCTELRRISRSNGTDFLVSSFLPNFAPYTVSCLDTKRKLIYSTFGPLNGGPGNVIAAIDPRTGIVVSNATFSTDIAYIELEYDPVTDRVYSVVESPQGTFFGTVEPATGVATPLGTKAYFNTTYWNQWNTISTIAPEIGVFFSTAFHYAIPSPPSDPILHVRARLLPSVA